MTLVIHGPATSYSRSCLRLACGHTIRLPGGCTVARGMQRTQMDAERERRARATVREVASKSIRSATP